MPAMKKINQRAKNVMDILTVGLDKPGDHCKIDNCDQTFMPVSVECIGLCRQGLIFSVCHYGEQNGDLMRDPEMTFLRDHVGDYFPLSFQNDYLGIFRESVFIEGDGPTRFIPALQRDHATFAGTWMTNIKEQQRL